jgi:hypothetical protein
MFGERTRPGALHRRAIHIQCAEGSILDAPVKAFAMTQPDRPLAANGLQSVSLGEAGGQAAAAPATTPQPTREEILEEVRQLVTDLRDATQDGRDLARRYADVLRNVVDEYCLEFEKRAEAALEKLENLK